MSFNLKTIFPKSLNKNFSFQSKPKSNYYTQNKSGDSRVANLGVRKPRPVVGVGPPGVWMLDGEGEAVVYGGHVDKGGRHLLPLLRGGKENF